MGRRKSMAAAAAAAGRLLAVTVMSSSSTWWGQSETRHPARQIAASLLCNPGPIVALFTKSRKLLWLLTPAPSVVSPVTMTGLFFLLRWGTFLSLYPHSTAACLRSSLPSPHFTPRHISPEIDTLPLPAGPQSIDWHKDLRASFTLCNWTPYARIQEPLTIHPDPTTVDDLLKRC